MRLLSHTLALNDTAGTNTPATKTLTASYATLDLFAVSHAGQLSFDFVYVPLSGQSNRTVSIQFEGSPQDLNTAEGSSDWFNIGIWTDASGTWSEETATYSKLGATGGTSYNLVAIEIPTTHQKVRVRVKEDGSANFGTIKGWANLICIS